MQSLPGGGGYNPYVRFPSQSKQGQMPYNPYLGTSGAAGAGVTQSVTGQSAQTPQPKTSGLYTTPIPNAPQYLQAQLLAKTAYENAVARLSNQRSGLLRNSGYTAAIGSDGSMGALSVDAHNPYGQYQQMMRSGAREDSNLQNQYAGRGLTGGLANRGQSDLRFQHGAMAAQFGTNLTNQLSDNAYQRQDASNTYNSALWQAEYQQAQDAINQQNFNQALNPATGQVGPAQVQPGSFDNSYTDTSLSAQAGKPRLGGVPYSGRFYTYKAQVQALLKPGQTIHYKPGRGYYPDYA